MGEVQCRAVTLHALVIAVVMTQAPGPSVPAPSEPPLVPTPLVLEPPPPPPQVHAPLREPETAVAGQPAKGAVLFAPLSVFGLYLSVEVERAITGGLGFFGVVGGGPFGQLGGDLGLRYYVLSTMLEGFFLDVRASTFMLPGAPMVLIGGNLGLGYAWRVRGATAISIGVGATVWGTAVRAPSGFGSPAAFIGTGIGDAQVFALPGFFQPPSDTVGIQPTVRFVIGPAF